MELNNFIKYLQDVLLQLKNERKKLNNDIKSLPNIEDYDYRKYLFNNKFLNNHEDLYHLKNYLIFRRKKKVNGVIRESIINSLNEECNKLDLYIYQITCGLQNILNGNKDYFYPNEYFIYHLMKYGSKYNVNCLDINNYMVNFFKNNKVLNSNDIIIELEYRYGNLYDNNGVVISDCSSHSLKFFFKKIGENIFIDKDIDTMLYYNLFVRQIILNCLLSKNSDEKDDYKRKFNKFYNSYLSFKDLVKDGKVVNACDDIDSFKKICSDLDIDPFTSTKLVNDMQKFKKSYDKSVKRDNMINCISKYVEGIEFDYIMKAFEIIDENRHKENYEVFMIRSNIFDIYSICKYLDLTGDCEDRLESYDYLSLKLSLLSVTVLNYINDYYGYGNLLYLYDDKYIPLIINDIDLMDIMDYRDVNESLMYLYEGFDGELIENNSIPLYLFSNLNCYIYYTVIKGHKILLNISMNDCNKFSLTDDIILRIKNMVKEFSFDELYKISYVHEKLISRELMVNSFDDDLVLRKELD